MKLSRLFRNFKKSIFLGFTNFNDEELSRKYVDVTGGKETNPSKNTGRMILAIGVGSLYHLFARNVFIVFNFSYLFGCKQF